MDEWEIEGRAMTPQMLPPGQPANGFYYFQADLQHGAILYLIGLYEAATNKEIFYFEFPLQVITLPKVQTYLTQL